MRDAERCWIGQGEWGRGFGGGLGGILGCGLGGGSRLCGLLGGGGGKCRSWEKNGLVELHGRLEVVLRRINGDFGWSWMVGKRFLHRGNMLC